MKTKMIGTALVIFALLGAAGWLLKSAVRETVFPSVDEIDRVAKVGGITDCFWFSRLSADGGFNLLYPDTGANYWMAQLKLPEGSRLDIEGEFPHARHLSFNVYDEDGQPADRMNDALIVPTVGSINPFVPGSARDASPRGYVITVLPGQVKAGESIPERDKTRPANTIYAPTDTEFVNMLMRIYVPDHGLAANAGVALPRPRLTHADGRVLTGNELCQAIIHKEKSVRDIRFTIEAARWLLTLKNSTSIYHPAQEEPRWHGFRNSAMSFASILDNTSLAWIKRFLNKERKGGFFSTLDNTYMFAHIDRRFGDVLTLRGKAPTTPKTRRGDAQMGSGQVRYWSICQNRSLYDSSVDKCVFDEDVTLDSRGDYVIAMSTPELRPANAKAECGVTWLPWGGGDGIDNPQGGMLIYRHMLPSPEFKESIFNIPAEGEEKRTMGAYYPRSAYQAKVAFEARGCRVR